MPLFVINIFWHAIQQFQKHKCDHTRFLFIFKNISFSSSEPIPQLLRKFTHWKTLNQLMRNNTTLLLIKAQKYYCLDNSCKRQHIVMSVLRSKYIRTISIQKYYSRECKTIRSQITITSFNFLKCYFVCFSCHETRK